MSIFELSELVNNLPAREKELFNRVYEVDIPPARLKLGSGIREWTEKRFGNAGEVESQKIVRVTNVVTLEGTLFNYLRGKRPVETCHDRDIDSLVEGYREGCPFCFPEERTPADVFGRITGRYCITAANVAKYDGYHGLVIPREHHPLKFNISMVEDYFQVAARWFTAATEYAAGEGGLIPYYPFLMWNCLWPAGSSVVHGHLQLTLTRGMHYPRVERLRRCAVEYYNHFGDSYFDDLFSIHSELGLGWKGDACRYIAILTPIKEKEIWILMPSGQVTEESLGRAGRAVYRVLDRLKEKGGLNSFNVALYLPPLVKGAQDWSGFPAIARLVDRGSVYDRTADVGAMELYAASVVSSDPFAVAEMLLY